MNLRNKVTGELSSITQYDLTTGNIIGLTPIGNSNLGSNSNVIIGGGNVGDVLTTDGTGNLSWGPAASTYGDSNVAAYLPLYTGDMGNANSITANSFITNDANAITLSGNLISSLGNITIDPLNDGTPAGNVTILGNVSVTGNLTYNDIANATTSNLVWIAAVDAASDIAASGGGLQVGNNSGVYATWLYNQPANAWQANLGIEAPYFTGDGANLTGLSAGSQILNGNSNVSIPTSAGDIKFNVNGKAVGTWGTEGVTLGNSSGTLGAATIMLNGSGAAHNAPNNGFYALPVRTDTGNVNQTLNYNTSTSEVTIGPAMAAFAGFQAPFSGQISFANMGQWLQVGGSVTLPQVSTVPAGTLIYMTNTAGSQVTPITVSVFNTGTDFIYYPPLWSGSGTRSVPFYFGQWMILMNRGSGEWDVVASNVNSTNIASLGPDTAWGTTLSMDNMKVQMQNDGYLYISAVSGTVAFKGSSLVLAFNHAPLNYTLDASINQGIWYQVTGQSLGANGDSVQLNVMDDTNNRIYRVTSTKQNSGPNQGSITIERLFG